MFLGKNISELWQAPTQFSELTYHDGQVITYTRKAYIVYHGFNDLKINLFGFVAVFAYFWVFGPFTNTKKCVQKTSLPIRANEN